ncbi:MAG TPA: acyl-CoA dehydrogenase family protein, partial [Verrucomicrobiae bacterium]|nr:acyl-CoA dehydrogenase family protein [Verrucomicrobiae bacterium]
MLLNEDQEALRRLAHEFAKKEIRPRSAEWDEKEEFPKGELAPKAVETGIWALAIPEEHGGVSLDAVTTCLINEELAWGCA